MTRRAFFATLLVSVAACAQTTALDRYVAQKDPVYAWKLVNTIPGEGVRTHVLKLTSQAWRSEEDVDRPVWKHWLTIVRPGHLTGTKALLLIGGGNNNNPAPSKPSERSERIARETGSVAVHGAESAVALHRFAR
jgi:PhoPQ-activated pathogenicity-related protein